MSCQNQKICLFAGYSPDSRIHDYVVHFIASFTGIADVHYLADCEMPGEELERLDSITVSAVGLRHGTYDFGSWQELIRRIGWEKISGYDEVILCNDSCYGPVFGFGEVFEKMARSDVDFWGLTSCPELCTLHLQSYFLVFKKDVVRSVVFRCFFESVSKHSDFWGVVTNYEIALTQMLANEGFRFGAYLDGESELSPPTFPLSILRDFRFPLIKIKAFTNPHTNLNERMDGIDEFVRSNGNYDPDLYRRHLEQVAPGYREGIEERFANRPALKPPAKAKKILVHLHLSHPEETPYFVSRLLEVPGEFALFVTLAEPSKLVGEQLAVFEDKVEVLEVGVEADDMSAFLRVVGKVRLDEYDLVLKLHSMGARFTREKLFGIDLWAYGWRNLLVDPLLESAQVLLRHLKSFRSEPDTGMFASAALTSTERWEMNDLVEKWASACGIESGDRPQPVVAGRMFLLRASALLPVVASGAGETITADIESRKGEIAIVESAFETFMSLLLLHGGLSLTTVGVGGCIQKAVEREEAIPPAPDIEPPVAEERLKLTKRQAGFLKKCLKLGKLVGVLDASGYRKLKEALRPSPDAE